MKPCTECGKPVSEQAKTCPHCGHPAQPSTAEILNKAAAVLFSCGGLLLALLLLYFLLKAAH